MAFYLDECKGQNIWHILFCLCCLYFYVYFLFGGLTLTWCAFKKEIVQIFCYYHFLKEVLYMLNYPQTFLANPFSVGQILYLSICPSVCPCVCVFTFEVPFKRLFAPTSRSRMSNIFRDSESLGEKNGKKWSQIWTFLFENCLKSPRKKKFFSSLFSLLRYRLTVFLPPLPKVGCPIFLEIQNPLGKVMERSGLRLEPFVWNCQKLPHKKKFFLLIFPFKTGWKPRFPMDLRPLVKGRIANFGIFLEIFEFFCFGYFFSVFQTIKVFGYTWSTRKPRFPID